MSRQDSKQIENVKVMLLKGESGSSIESIEKTGTSGLVDTYTVTLTDGSKTTFNVTNGKYIVSIAKTGTQGLVDTYTITFNDDTTETFTVTNGKSISSIAKTGTQGLVDTYTITYNDGTTDTFNVTNGADGGGEALAEAYDDTKAYVKGEYFLYQSKVAKVLANISAGDSLVENTNYKFTTIGEELSSKITYNGSPANITLSLVGDVLTITTN